MTLVVPAAMALDAALGEPPAIMHPTVWMGRWIAAGRRRASKQPAPGAFGTGMGITVAGTALAGGAGWFVERLVRLLDLPFGFLLEAAALKPAFALSALLEAGREVEQALRAGNLWHARDLVSRHLVSRDTATLSASDVAGAAVSSLAENLSDGFVAPLLAWRLAGLGGAYAYRFINTADSMLGYRTPDLEWLGKFAARTDDLVNMIPSRLAALLIALAAPTGGGSIARACRVAWRDAGRTASPNAGWPMAAMAGALGVRLVKHGHYALHDDGAAPDHGTIRRARHILTTSAIMAGALVLL